MKTVYDLILSLRPRHLADGRRIQLVTDMRYNVVISIRNN